MLWEYMICKGLSNYFVVYNEECSAKVWFSSFKIIIIGWCHFCDEMAMMKIPFSPSFPIVLKSTLIYLQVVTAFVGSPMLQLSCLHFLSLILGTIDKAAFLPSAYYSFHSSAVPKEPQSCTRAAPVSNSKTKSG